MISRGRKGLKVKKSKGWKYLLDTFYTKKKFFSEAIKCVGPAKEVSPESGIASGCQSHPQMNSIVSESLPAAPCTTLSIGVLNDTI